MKSEPLERFQFEAARLMEEHPPRWRHPNKQAVFDVVRSAKYPFAGLIHYARWPKQTLPQTVAAHTRFQIHPGMFTYNAHPESTSVEWHMNFADPRLFTAYGSSLLAQDELQVLEHPVLGALREALVSMGVPAETVDADGQPSPVTVTGVQRRCLFDTRPDPAAGRPHSLYGNAFARATAEEVVAATHVLAPPTFSHILALAAPAYGYGTYAREEIDTILSTAYSGFQAARWESAGLAAASFRTLIHTGFWGCGAFGGNRTLMTILQALAADLADVDLVFHTVDEPGGSLAEEAYRFYMNLRNTMSSVSNIMDRILERKFEWGVSDGN
ncbi:MAG: hypothetical protein ACE15F_14420 [bacterium]